MSEREELERLRLEKAERRRHRESKAEDVASHQTATR